MRILVLEPYHGASHKRFLDDLEEHLSSEFEFTRLTQPARAWKWRMRFAAPHFVNQLAGLGDQEFDLIIASTFVSLADFRGLAPQPFCDLPVVVYWHENQWAYPVRKEDERDRHFVVTNFTTAMAADLNLFNSEWNRTSLMAGLRQVLKEIPDTDLSSSLAAIEKKSEVLAPPMTRAVSERCGQTPAAGKQNHVPRILWNHRWEHDKNPEEFFGSLFTLMDEGVAFEVIVAGQSYATWPEVFDEARTRLGERIVHWGFAESPETYTRLLESADIVVSTAHHEFFGLAVMEAVFAGALPLVPDHLSYPEIYPAPFRYPAGKLTPSLRTWLVDSRPSRNSLGEVIEGHRWSTQKPLWEKVLQHAAGLRRE